MMDFLPKIQRSKTNTNTLNAFASLSPWGASFAAQFTFHLAGFASGAK